ncbi:MAG: hypothetical protein J6K39_00095 [Clostridia bacterium]|nr:hypothetical protein [Clostridia bacterium]
MYFNYHAKVQRLIKAGHATGFEMREEYHKISPCLLIFFDNHPPMPIRQHRFDEYFFLLARFDVLEREEWDVKKMKRVKRENKKQVR